ncbi:hypothetical protein [Phocaeicola plebeius]|jgi:hypothetical protein|uniref:hypothetical protein n=1 Tax=Phocaeicola plebeius TaxID=310297 RepID=UPI0015B569BF|nr:hypothetical protein [Phocaeicola plebeius]MCI6050703.1 hypothetical protein [Phocaeicola plebeius]MCR8883446.1 hypothetical protein [Phocaeicola plebeius]MDD6912633.1 hypothetical protein [Phocaeicola plebeius]MDM8286704.1 hypothetical protein [Phocaeicola plebeius]MDY5978148.1 hypothetical protein [Phocaeicola plebeius]
MKHIKFIFTLMLLTLFVAAPAMAQQTSKELKKELKSKASKDIRKEAKAYEKEGWRSVAGSLPLAKQLEQAQMAAIERDEEGLNRYYLGRGKGVGGNYRAAKAVAFNQAKVDLVAAVMADVASTEVNDMTNEDLGEGDVLSTEDMTINSKVVSSFPIKDIITVVEIYRELSRGRYEVEMTVKMEAADAKKRAKIFLNDQRKAAQQK